MVLTPMVKKTGESTPQDGGMTFPGRVEEQWIGGPKAAAPVSRSGQDAWGAGGNRQGYRWIRNGDGVMGRN